MNTKQTETDALTAQFVRTALDWQRRLSAAIEEAHFTDPRCPGCGGAKKARLGRYWKYALVCGRCQRRLRPKLRSRMTSFGENQTDVLLAVLEALTGRPGRSRARSKVTA